MVGYLFTNKVCRDSITLSAKTKEEASRKSSLLCPARSIEIRDANFEEDLTFIMSRKALTSDEISLIKLDYIFSVAKVENDNIMLVKCS